MKNINELTITEAKQDLEETKRRYEELSNIFNQAVGNSKEAPKHEMLGLRCLIRTYSAGVHIGTVAYVNPENSMEVKLTDSLRLWKWEGGGLSLSAVANNGIKDGRLNKTGDVFLTNAIEYIPTNPDAEKTYIKFIED